MKACRLWPHLTSARRDLCIIWPEDTGVTHDVRMRYFVSKYFVSCCHVGTAALFRNPLAGADLCLAQNSTCSRVLHITCLSLRASSHPSLMQHCPHIRGVSPFVYAQLTPAHLTHFLQGRRIYLECSLEGPIASKSRTICCSFAALGLKYWFVLEETRT